MSVRDGITGDYTREQVMRWSWPIAWSGTVSAERRAQQERELEELRRECLDALDDDQDASVAVVVRGVLLGTGTRGGAR